MAVETSGIKVFVDNVVIGHLDTIGSIIDKSRGVTKKTPLNDTQFDEIVALGSMTYGQFNATVVYDPSATEGINDLEVALETKETVTIKIELNDSKGVNGTTVEQSVKVSSFKVDGAKDDFLMASFTAERIGDATVTAAA